VVAYDTESVVPTVSPLTVPVTEPVRVGRALPYGPLALATVTVRPALLMVSVPGVLVSV